MHRYIALERTFASDEGDATTVLGEWEENSHLNYGEGPPPDADAFFARVCDMLIINPDLHAQTSMSSA